MLNTPWMNCWVKQMSERINIFDILAKRLPDLQQRLRWQESGTYVNAIPARKIPLRQIVNRPINVSYVGKLTSELSTNIDKAFIWKDVPNTFRLSTSADDAIDSYFARGISDLSLIDSSFTMVIYEKTQEAEIADIKSAVAALQNNNIIVPDPETVTKYLIRHPNTYFTVFAICAKARTFFERDTELSLEVYQDPEISDEYLTLYVRQHDYQDNLLDKIEEITERLDLFFQIIRGKLLITTDFGSPKH